MYAFMPPDAIPPNDERAPDVRDANVVESEVLAERRAQRAENAERSATRRAADAQSLAADLARERARLEAERDAARAEAAAAREGADAVKAEAQHLQAERDALRIEVERGITERETLRAELEHVRAERGSAVEAPVAATTAAVAPAAATPVVAAPNGNGAAIPAAWADGLRRELAVARAAAARPRSVADRASTGAAAGSVAASAPGAGEPSTKSSLGRERELVARRASEAPATGAVSPAWVAARAGERATPLTALALERERSSRLRAELEQAATVEAELRAQLAALEQAVAERRDAERRIEMALQRVRSEFDDARQLAAEQDAPVAGTETTFTGEGNVAAADPEPGSVVAARPVLPAVPEGLASRPAPAASPAGVVDAERLDAAQARLRAAASAEPEAPARHEPDVPEPPTGPLAPWLPAALRKLAGEDARAAGRILTAMLPAQGLVTERKLRYDLVLTDRGSVIGVDVGEGGTSVRPSGQPRSRRDVDFRLTTDEETLARLLLSRRGRRRGARLRGSRRRLRELRRLGSEPLALSDLAHAGAMSDPLLALAIVALAVEPAATYGHRFTIAHAPLAGGPADAWLRIQNGVSVTAVRTCPPERPTLTIRSTRGALLPLLAGVDPPPGESAVLDGDPGALTLLRGWIARTEFPAS